MAKRASVRIFVRDIDNDAARRLSLAGAELAKGEFDDPGSLERAMDGVQGVFSVQQAPHPDDPDAERRHGSALIAAARAADVAQFVHSSVSNAGDFRAMPGWAEGQWERNYWESKALVEDKVIDAGFESFTILRPAFMMENFLPPKFVYMFPGLAEGRVETLLDADTHLAFVAAADIGSAATIAFSGDARLRNEVVELAGDWLTMPQVAAILSHAAKCRVTAIQMQSEALASAGLGSGWIAMQEWLEEIGYPGRPAAMEAVGLVPTSFSQWAARHAEALTATIRQPME